MTNPSFPMPSREPGPEREHRPPDAPSASSNDAHGARPPTQKDGSIDGEIIDILREPIGLEPESAQQVPTRFPIRPRELNPIGIETNGSGLPPAASTREPAQTAHPSQPMRPVRPAEPSQPFEPAQPVRPAHPHQPEPLEVLDGPQAAGTSPASAPIHEKPEEPADERLPCPTCGYDLRGRPGGARCPECGTTIRARKRPVQDATPTSPGGRDAIVSAWHGLSTTSLFSVFPLTPIPYIIPVGIALAVCAGFTPCFRLFALRGLEQLPDPLRRPVAHIVRRFRNLEIAELAIAGTIAVGALLATFGVIGRAFVPLYASLLVAWWVVSVFALSAQVRLADLLSRLLVDPEMLPLEVPPRILRWLRLALVAGLAGAACVAYATFGKAMFGASAASFVGIALVLAACVLHAVASLHARAQANLVANCVFENDHFRTRPRRRTPKAAPVEPEPESADAVPASKRHSYTPRNDDGPIKLPGE